MRRTVCIGQSLGPPGAGVSRRVYWDLWREQPVYTSTLPPWLGRDADSRPLAPGAMRNHCPFTLSSWVVVQLQELHASPSSCSKKSACYAGMHTRAHTRTHLCVHICAHVHVHWDLCTGPLCLRFMTQVHMT